ncbi:MAG TPA: hypothetical protein PLW65_12975 [Pseudomonadota bacterium]|nr:hypothetical protein [Pseudomonadota bacterium]
MNCFDKQTEELAQDLPLTGVTLRQLQELFNVSVDDPMSDSYRIEPWHAEKLQPFLSEKLDLKNCNCYLDGYAVNTTGPSA